MIGYIKGQVKSIDGNNVLIVSNGIGFEVCVSSSCLKTLQVKSEGEIYVYTALREDGIYLYGFSSPEEKAMFLKLITVSGVGPKMGITVLSYLSLSDLAIKIATSDVKGLSSVKGLGKKTAERIILELREKIGTVADENGEVVLQSDSALSHEDNDAVIALMSLGLSKSECVSGIKNAKSMGAKTIQEIISLTLRNMR